MKSSGFFSKILSFSIVGSIAGVAAFGLGLLFLRTEFPDVSRLKTEYPVVRYQGRGLPVTVSLQKASPPQWVPLSGISRVAVGAVIVSEDWAFYQHDGYDMKQIREAIKEDWEEGRFSRGASTITQQVVKNVFLSSEKSLWRKFKELVLAVRIENRVGKRRILETYLNIAEWGEGVFGIGPAAQVYFGKSPAELTAKEGAFLAMLLPSPKRYSQSFRAHELTPYARGIIRSILGKMEQARYLSPEEKLAAWTTPLAWEKPLLPGAVLPPETTESTTEPPEFLPEF